MKNEAKPFEVFLSSGIAPLEMMYAPVKYTSGGELVAFRSFLQINSLDLGPLLPEQYSEISNRTVLANRLSSWALKSICSDIQKLEFYNNKYMFVTLYMSAKMVISGMAYKTINNYLNKSKFSLASKICIEIPTDILFYETTEVTEKLNDLKKLGIKLAIGDFGDEFCPMMRLKPLPFDIVFLHKNVGYAFMNEQKEADSVIKLCTEMGLMTVIVADISDDKISKAYYQNCEAYHSLQPQKLQDIAMLGGGTDE